MGDLEQLLNDTESAITNRDLARLRGDLTLRGTVYFINALKGVGLTLRTKDALNLVKNESSVPDELKSLLNGNDTRRLKIMLLLIKICEMNRSHRFNTEASLLYESVMSNKAVAQYMFCGALDSAIEEIAWNKDIEPFDLRFLSGTNTSHPQTVMGKPKKEGKIYPPFKKGFLQEMSPAYFPLDIECTTILLTTEEKKQFKLRKESGGHLTRGHKKIASGNYLYAVSPKGSIYVMNQSDTKIRTNQSYSTHHSSMRAGQPVLAAGSLEFGEDTQTGHMKIILMDRGTGHYGTSKRNFLLTALWLSEQKMIDDDCKLQGVDDYSSTTDVITVHDLLTLDQFKAIRKDYEDQKLEAANPPSSSDLSGPK